MLLLAKQDGLEQIDLGTVSNESLAVLVDVPKQRMLIGPANLLQSTFTRLMYLDGRYASHFELMNERTGSFGNRIVTWKIHW